MTTPAPIHAVPGQVVGPGQPDHRASDACPCNPVPVLRDLATGAVVWIHYAKPPQERLDQEPADAA